MLTIEVNSIDSFKEYAKKVIEMLNQKEPSINESVDIICAMRFWLLGEILEDRITNEEFEFNSYILNHLDKTLEVVFTKESLKKYGVGN